MAVRASGWGEGELELEIAIAMQGWGWNIGSHLLHPCHSGGHERLRLLGGTVCSEFDMKGLVAARHCRNGCGRGARGCQPGLSIWALNLGS